MDARKLFKYILVLVFLIGGIIQLSGILSVTMMTFGITCVLLFNRLFTRTSGNMPKWAFIYVAALIFLSAALNSSNLFLCTLYIFSFLVVPYTIHHFINGNAHKFDFKKTFDALLLIGILQLPVIIFQHTFTETILLFSSRPMDPEDVGFGTFFYANDHALCFFILCLITYLLFEPGILSTKKKIYMIFWLSLTVLVARSNISFLLLIMVFLSYLFSVLNIKKIVPLLIGIVVLFFLISLVENLSAIIFDKVDFMVSKIFEKDYDLYSGQRLVERGIAERSDIFLYFVNDKIKYFGEGPYNYFDPISGTFPKFINFSQYLWFYNDIGIFSIVGIAFIYVSIFLKKAKLDNYKLIYLVMILAYSYFTNTLADLAFNIIFAIFLLLPPKRNRTQSHEHRLHPLP